MFYVVEALLLKKNIKVKTHSGLVSKFGELYIKTKIFPKEMGKNLRKAFDKRLIGDYAFLEEINKDEAQLFLEIGKGFIKKIDEYLRNY